MSEQSVDSPGVEVIVAPDTVPLKVGDSIELTYPGDKNMCFNWLGSIYPWIEQKKNNKSLFLMGIPSRYIKSESDSSWKIDNKKTLFAPWFPTGRSPSGKNK